MSDGQSRQRCQRNRIRSRDLGGLGGRQRTLQLIDGFLVIADTDELVAELEQGDSFLLVVDWRLFDLGPGRCQRSVAKKVVVPVGQALAQACELGPGLLWRRR